jgi:hypothetical protein
VTVSPAFNDKGVAVKSAVLEVELERETDLPELTPLTYKVTVIAVVVLSDDKVKYCKEVAIGILCPFIG